MYELLPGIVWFALGWMLISLGVTVLLCRWFRWLRDDA